VRPPHDDSPFFWDFFRVEAIPVLQHAYGSLWLTRVEMGRMFLYASLVIAAAAAVILILVPLLVVEMTSRRRARTGGDDARESERAKTAVIERKRGGALACVVYFTAIGLGFMGIEMALISRAIHFVGDPVIASAVVIAGVLVLSGVGSLSGGRWVGRRLWLAPTIVAAAAGVICLIGWPAQSGLESGPTSGMTLTLLALPLAYAMGIPMPTAISVLNRDCPRLTPWAWGVNGVASVIATSTAILIAMSSGYSWVMLAAAALYAVAAVAAIPLARETPQEQDVTVAA